MQTVLRVRKSTQAWIYGLLSMVFVFSSVVGWGQVSIPNTTAVVQNFDGMGTNSALPSNWKMAASTTAPVYSSASTSVTQIASSGSTPSAGGTYNWGNISPTTDRAVGAMTSGAFASPNNLMGYFRNTNTSNLTQLTVSYTVERYRINTAAASIQFYYSLDGSNWVSVGDGDIASSSLPTGSSTYSSNPSGTPTNTNAGIITKTGIVISGLSISPNSDVYLRWNINTTGSNSQGLGIDDIGLTATFGTTTSPSLSVSPSSLTGFTYVQGSGPSTAQSFTVSGSNLSPASGNVTITGSTNYEVSTASATTGFANTATLAYSGGTMSNAGPVYVRLKGGLSAGTYNNETISVSGGGATTNATVSVSGTVTTPAPANDLCGNAIALTPGASATAGTTVGATATSPFSSPDVWYTVTPTASGVITVSSTQSAQDLNLYIFSGSSCPISTTAIAEGVSGSTTIETVRFTATAGVTYYIRVEFFTGTQGSFNIQASVPVPTPTITSLSPSSVLAGSGAQTLTINGTNFVSGTTTVTYNGATKTPTFVSATQITIPLTASDVTTPGSYPIVVTNTGNSTTATANLSVTSPTPTITSLSPSSVVAGSGATTLTINGTNFIGGTTTVTYNGATKTPTLVSSTQMTITLTSANTATAGTYPVVVTNSGNSTTATANFVVTQPAPTVTSATVPGNYGTALSYQIIASNSPTSYAITSGTLPAGLTLNTTTGIVSGTPTVVVSGVAVGVSATNGTGTGNGTLTFNIGQKTLTVTGLSSTKVYDGTNSAPLTGTPTLNGVVAGDNVTLSGTPTATYANPNVAATKAVTVTGYTLSGTDASKYTLTQPSFNGSITVKPLTITGVTANDKVYDGTIPTTLSGTPVLNGVIGTDNVSIVSGSGSAKFDDPNVGTNKPVTVTGYTLTGTAANNYSVTNGMPTGLTASITKADQTIAFPALPANKTTADADFDPGATTTASGVTITYSSSNASVATIVNGKIHIVGAGTTTITASQPGNNNYNAATPVQQTLTVVQGVFENFEATTKPGGYADGAVTFKSGQWQLNDALVGSPGELDHVKDDRGIRVRNTGSLYMLFDITNGAKSVSVYHASFSSDALSSTWKMQASTDGGTSWTDVSSPITTSSYMPTQVSFNVNFQGNVRFKIVKLSGGSNRINFDDFDYVGQDVGAPIFALGAASNRCQGAETLSYTATATNTTGITYTLDATSTAAGNTINSSTGAVTYTASWTGTSTITASAAGANGPKTATHTVTTRTQPSATISASQTSLCANEPAAVITFTGANGVAPYTFNYNINGGSTLSVASTGNTATVSVSTMAGTYTYNLLSVAGTYCNQNQSGSVSVEIKAAPALFSVFGGGSYCSTGGNSGTGAPIGLTNSQTGVNYTLYKDGVSTGTVVAGTDASISFGNIKPVGTYTVVATNATTGCTQTMLGSASIVINSFPTSYSVGGSGTYCATANVTLSGSQNNTFYQLIKDGEKEGSDIAGTGSPLAIPVTATGNYTINAFNPNCANSMNGVAIVTINPLPTAYTVTGGGTYCSGTSGAAVGLSNSQTGITYTLLRGGTSTGVTRSGTGSAISFGNQTATGTYTVSAANSSTGCTNTMTGSVVVAMNPTPTASISASSLSSCEGTGVSVTVSGTPGAVVSYTLNSITQSPDITIPAGGNTSINSPGDAGTYTYTISSVSLNTCNGTAGSTTGEITVYPKPVVTAISGPAGVGIGQTITLSESTIGGTWSASNSNATLDAATANPVTVTGQTTGQVTISYTVVNPSQTSCSTTVQKLVTVYNAATSSFITKQNGVFNDPATWQVDLGGNNFIDASNPPSAGNSITVLHALNLNVDFAAAANFNIVSPGTMSIAPNHYFALNGGVADFGGNSVTVQSDATGSGAIGSGTILNATNVTVERYIPAKRAWRLITSPITNATINEAWQQGSLWNGTTADKPASTGTGTLITGYMQNNAANANSHGYDFWEAIKGSYSSLRYYSPGVTSGTWRTFPEITGKLIVSEPAYMLFVRGDRSVTTGAGATTLSATGTLFQSSKEISVPVNRAYTLVGNPYASPIDFEQIYSLNSSIIKPQFLAWNSSLSDYGAYILVQKQGANYTTVPYPLTTTPAIDNAARFIQSGQGILVQPENGGNLNLTDAAKAPNETAATLINPFRENAFLDKKLYVNLNIVTSDSTATLADGLLARFDAIYSDATEKKATNVLKAANFNENLGIATTDSTSLMVEARPEIAKTDTLQLKLWNVTKRGYQLQMKAERFDSLATLHAWLEDRYLGTKEEISLSGAVSSFSFAVTSDSLSWKADRFRIVFQNQGAVLPVTLTSLTATAKNGGVNVSWTVTNEANMKSYTVEKSADGGRTSAVMAEQAAKNAAGAALTTYNSFDATPQKGDNLYRIRMTGKDGSVTYSQWVKVTIEEGKGSAEIVLYPNPVKEGKAWLQLSKMEKGSYRVGVYGAGGQRVYERKIEVADSASVQTEELKLGKALAGGSYTLVLTNSNGEAVFQTQMIVEN